MSGIYIPDVGLPQDGDFELWIAVRKDGSFTYNVRGGWQDGIQKVVPVPEHGDLIDRCALELDVQKRLLICNKNDNQFQKPYEIMRAIALAPTIIEDENSTQRNKGGKIE